MGQTLGNNGKFWLLVTFVAIFTFITVNALTESQIEEIDNFIENEYLSLNNIPGLALAIVHANDTLAKGYGLANIELGIPVENRTLIPFASIAKSFTGLIVVRILNSRFPELGESVLDVPIRTLVPSYNFMLLDRFRTENMNFRDLLSHRVCVKNGVLAQFVRNYASTEEYMYRQRYAESVCDVRTQWAYSSGLVQMAGELAAVIANATFPQLLEDFLVELGMTETTYIKESYDLESWPNLAKPYYLRNGVLERFNLNITKAFHTGPGTAGLISSSADFVRYLTFHLNKGRIGSVQIVPEELMDWTRRLSIPIPGLVYKTQPSDLLHGNLGNGLGVYVGTHEGFFKYGHTGGAIPYWSLFTIVPELNVAVMTNSNGPGILANITQEFAHAKLISIITGVGNVTDKSVKTKPPQTKHSSEPDQTMGIKQGNKIPSYLLKNWQPKNDNLIGMYGSPQLGEFNIIAINSTRMYLSFGMFGQGYLIQRGNSSVYEIQWDGDFIQFLYAYVSGEELPIATLDFTTPFIAELAITKGLEGGTFYKDLSLDLLPVQPWDPESCSTNYSYKLYYSSHFVITMFVIAMFSYY